ncbi:ATP synthase subunit e, mitochondrial-like [Littorina saxatilis]|uniref:ATP synthase F(0) complex subunit e, mitochondrial n=1 Tax=Littorina saxatilis TaxID=31220 RepID=A0AAN9BPT2_9CAEN
MATLGAPRQISPLIRFGRYAALFTGLVYGSYHLRSLTNKEEAIQEHENKLKVVRDARMKMEKERNTEVEMTALGRECGVVKG